MTVKEYLQQAFVLDKEIRAKQEQIVQLREMQTSIGSTLKPDKVQSTPPADPMGDSVAAVVDLTNEYAKDVCRLMMLKQEISDVVNQVPDARHRLILFERYINLKPFEDIAADNGYCERYAKKLNANAIKELKEVVAWEK